MHVGEVSERTGLSIRTLRHYDDLGLVPPSGRTSGGFRLYTAADEARVLLVKAMKPLGYSLDQMRSVLGVIDSVAVDPGSPELQEELRTIYDEARARHEKLEENLIVAANFIETLRSYHSVENAL